MIRLLLLRKTDLVADNEWQELFKLESHQNEFELRGGTTLQDLVLMAKAVHAYSATGESFDLVLRLCCVFAVNSFTLTSPTFEPLGAAMHPLPALINHSCVPNAYVRFDIHPPSSTYGIAAAKTKHPYIGTISVHAIDAIPEGEEIRISYIDAHLPTPKRQTELADRYHFTCMCSRCFMGPTSLTDIFPDAHADASAEMFRTLNIEEAEREAIQTLENLGSQTHSSSVVPSVKIGQIRSAFRILADTRRWPAWRYPYLQLRQIIIPILIEEGNYYEAMLQAAIKSFPSEKALCDSEDHPTRILGKWLVYQIARICLISKLDADKGLQTRWLTLPSKHEIKIIATLMCSMLQEVVLGVLPQEYQNGTEPEILIEQAALKRIKSTPNPSSVMGTSSEAPPPYVGPETPPKGLPQYRETDPNSKNADDGGNEYPGSNMGQFEWMVFKAVNELRHGECHVFWAAYKDGSLFDEMEFKLEIQKRINGMLDEEESYETAISE